MPETAELGAQVKPVGWLKLSQLTKSESLHPWPLRTRSRANERLIIGMVLARKRGLRSDATGEHLTRDRCCAVHLTRLPQHPVVQQPEIRYVVWRARRDSNPRPADPKSDARGSRLAPLFRAQPNRSNGPGLAEIRVSMVPTVRRSLVPTLVGEGSDARVLLASLKLAPIRRQEQSTHSSGGHGSRRTVALASAPSSQICSHERMSRATSRLIRSSPVRPYFAPVGRTHYAIHESGSERGCPQWLYG